MGPAYTEAHVLHVRKPRGAVTPGDAQSIASVVEIYYKGRRLDSHPRRYDHQPSTKAEHMPSAHRAHAEWTP